MAREFSLSQLTYPNGMVARVANGEGFDQQCPATDGESRCSYPAGHAALTTDDSNTYAHARVDDSGALVVAWNPDAPPLADTADPGYAERLAGLRERIERAEAAMADADPTEAICPAISSHGDVCTLANGHPLPHERHVSGERVASWATSARTEAPAVDSDAERLRELIERAMTSGRVKVFTNAGDSGMCRRHPAPVRVRFIDLPHVHTEHRGPLGSPLYVAAPGGFALVVDRFRDGQHCRDERARWDEFGASIGAKIVLCYPGELDITDWYAD